MALGRTAKKPTQVLLLPVNQSRWAIVGLLRAECSSGSLDTEGAPSTAGLPQHTLPEQPGRVKHKASGFLGTVRSAQHAEISHSSTQHTLPTVTELKQPLPERLCLCLPPPGRSSCLPPPWRQAFGI